MSELTQLDLIKSYVDNTKSIVNISSAGLILPVIIKSEIFGLFHDGDSYNLYELILISFSWIFFLITIGAAILYQHVAIKFVEYRAYPNTTNVHPLLSFLVIKRGPGFAYGVMVISFYSGAITVVLYSFAAIFL